MERIKFGRLKTSLSPEQLRRKGIGNEMRIFYAHPSMLFVDGVVSVHIATIAILLLGVATVIASIILMVCAGFVSVIVERRVCHRSTHSQNGCRRQCNQHFLHIFHLRSLASLRSFLFFKI